jgi:hypothetical protein
MKKFVPFSLLLAVIWIAACSGQSNYHKTELPDPASFNGHFGDMDADADALVDWEEFKAFFPQAVPEVFEAIDMNHDKGLDHDEWHAFKDAHGLREHD